MSVHLHRRHSAHQALAPCVLSYSVKCAMPSFCDVPMAFYKIHSLTQVITMGTQHLLHALSGLFNLLQWESLYGFQSTHGHSWNCAILLWGLFLTDSRGRLQQIRKKVAHIFHTLTPKKGHLGPKRSLVCFRTWPTFLAVERKRMCSETHLCRSPWGTWGPLWIAHASPAPQLLVLPTPFCDALQCLLDNLGALWSTFAISCLPARPPPVTSHIRTSFFNYVFSYTFCLNEFPFGTFYFNFHQLHLSCLLNMIFFLSVCECACVYAFESVCVIHACVSVCLRVNAYVCVCIHGYAGMLMNMCTHV